MIYINREMLRNEGIDDMRKSYLLWRAKRKGSRKEGAKKEKMKSKGRKD